jgi:hypothetical protein
MVSMEGNLNPLQETKICGLIFSRAAKFFGLDWLKSADGIWQQCCTDLSQLLSCACCASAVMRLSNTVLEYTPAVQLSVLEF